MVAKKCVFCSHDETIQHLFFDCHFAKFLWRVVQYTFGLVPPTSAAQFYNDWLFRFDCKSKMQLLCGVSALSWALWLSRNDIVLTILLWKLICRYCSGPHIGFGCGRCFKSVMMTLTCWRMYVDHWRQWLCKFSPTMDGDLAIGLLLNKFPWKLCWCLLFTFVNFMSVFADGGAAVWCNKWVVGCSL